MGSEYRSSNIPTWEEFYDEWYNKGEFTESISINDENPDHTLRWTRYILAKICNMFNQQIQESNKRDELTARLSEYTGNRVCDLRFKLTSSDPYEASYSYKEEIYLTFITYADCFPELDPKSKRKSMSEFSKFDRIKMYMTISYFKNDSDKKEIGFFPSDSIPFILCMQYLVNSYIHAAFNSTLKKVVNGGEES